MSVSRRLLMKYIRTKFKLLSTLSKRKAAEKAFELFCTPQKRTIKKGLPVFDHAEKLHFTFQGNTIKGYRWNHPSDKKILILHGYESSIVNFDQFIEPLVNKGYEVLGFDAMAHGASSGKMINVLLYKELILQINDLYGPIQSFMGHSLGGLALSLALEDLPHDASFKSVFIAPATETTTASDQLFQILKLDSAVRKEFDLLIQEKSGHPASWFSAARASDNIKATVLWAHDKEDDMTPYKDIESIINSKHSNFKFLITEGLGHRRIYRNEKISREIIDFL
ncbi:MAG: alpha/beta fold hydrolase [Chitinophagaceae bacterium]